MTGGIGNANAAENLDRTRSRRPPRDAFVSFDDKAHLSLDGEYRIQRSHRILENHRDRSATDAPEFFGPQRAQVLTEQTD